MAKILHHSSFNKEIEDYFNQLKINSLTYDRTIATISKLIDEHVNNKISCLPPGKFGRAENVGGMPIYWVKPVIIGAKIPQSKAPKCYVYADENYISLLSTGNHTKNYKDSEVRGAAIDRAKEMLEYFKTLEE